MVATARSQGQRRRRRPVACCYPAPVLLPLLARATAARLWVLGARRRRERAGAAKLVVYRIGPRRGEPWLLLHGLGSTALSWAPVLSRFRREFRCLVPELSVLGGSRIQGGALPICDAVDGLVAILERNLPGRAVTVAGISLGGWMAVRLALARPDLVSRLVLIDAGGYRDQDWDAIESLVRVDALADVDRLYGALFAETPWIFRVSRKAFLQAYTSRAVRRILDTTTFDDAYGDEDLARIDCPTELVWGDRDGLFPLAVAQRMAVALPHGHLSVLEGCGHAVHWECPGALCAAIEAFRSRHPLPPRDASAENGEGAE